MYQNKLKRFNYLAALMQAIKAVKNEEQTYWSYRKWENITIFPKWKVEKTLTVSTWQPVTMRLDKDSVEYF